MLRRAVRLDQVDRRATYHCVLIDLLDELVSLGSLQRCRRVRVDLHHQEVFGVRSRGHDLCAVFLDCNRAPGGHNLGAVFLDFRPPDGDKLGAVFLDCNRPPGGHNLRVVTFD